jgi:hypothetical protein
MTDVQAIESAPSSPRDDEPFCRLHLRCGRCWESLGRYVWGLADYGATLAPDNGHFYDMQTWGEPARSRDGRLLERAAPKMRPRNPSAFGPSRGSMSIARVWNVTDRTGVLRLRIRCECWKNPVDFTAEGLETLIARAPFKNGIREVAVRP